MIGAAGAVAGLIVAGLMLALTLQMLPEGFRLSGMNAIDLDTRAIAFTALVGLIASALFGLPPAWLASRGAVAEAHRGDARDCKQLCLFARQHRSKRRMRRGFGWTKPDRARTGEVRS